ncbi:MAG: putative capsid protein [Circoviridae sp.]|nr:MAG: putative capsid protein [Circoviridae sp.]
MPKYRVRRRKGGGAQTSRPKGLTRLQTKSVKAIAKDVAMGIPEVKSFGFLDENRQLLHNKTDYLTNFLSCKQGTADPDDFQAANTRLVRIGDEFLLKSVNIRLWLSNKLDRPNVMYKCFLFWYDTDATLGDSLCWFTQQNKMLDRINNETISIIDQQTIFSGPSYENGTEKHEHSYLCTLKGRWKGKKITYDEGGTAPKKRTIGMMVVCYDAFGTLQTDNIASYAYNARIDLIDP